MKNYRWFIFLLILMNGNFIIAIAQKTKSKQGTIKDPDGSGAVSSITVGGDYYSNTNSLGFYTNDQVQPSWAPSVSYYGKSGLYASNATFFIQNADSSLSGTAVESDLEAGYQWTVTSFLTLTPSYVHLFYSKNMNALRSTYSDYADLSADIRTKSVFATLTTFYVFGNQNAFVLDVQSGLDLEFNNFPGNGNLLSVQPALSFDFNNQDYYHRFAFVYFFFLEPFASSYPGMTINDFNTYLQDHPKEYRVRVIQRYLDRHPKIDRAYRKLKPSTKLTDLFAVQTKFNLSSVGFTVPVSFAIGNVTFDLTFSALKPMNLPSFMDSKWMFTGSAGVTYSFNW